MAGAQNWKTPKWITDRFGPYDLDVAADASNTKAPVFYTENDNGLVQSWWPGQKNQEPHTLKQVWCNPPHPYKRGLARWADKCVEAENGSFWTSVDLLAPCRPCAQWFQLAVANAT